MKLIVDTEYRGHHSEYLDNLINNPLAKDQIFLLHPQYVKSKSLKFRDKIVYYEYEPKTSYLNKLIELRFINEIIKIHNLLRTITTCTSIIIKPCFWCSADVHLVRNLWPKS